jgi:DNA-binding transcriptional MocR family regulator
MGKGSGLHVTLKLDKKVNRDVFIKSCEAVGILLEPVVGYNDSIVVFSYSGILDDQMMDVVKTMCRIAEESAHIIKS